MKNAGERILVDRDLPARIPDEGFWLVFDRTASSDGVILRNCTFEDMEMRTLINVSNATVEDCVFRRTNGDALRCIADYTLTGWAEGMGTTNVVVRNCRFEGNCVREMVGATIRLVRTSLRGSAVRAWSTPDVSTGGSSLTSWWRTAFVDSLGYFADLRFGTRLTLRNNRIVQTGTRSRCRANSGFVRVERVSDVTFENNVFERLDDAPPQLDVGKDVEGLVVSGNRVVRKAGGIAVSHEGI